ncbi:MAG: ClbS/DfsB family four-helix bundle protein [Chloroflexi bacterium]|nr:ClbS/DfsB family four-helix bundle protein [Chloroflexota bacterium]
MPITKQQLIAQLQQERATWEDLLAEIGLERMEIPGVTADWTMKDTLAHLTTWWRREMARAAAAQRDEIPPDHPPPSDVEVINQWIYLINRDRPLKHVLNDAQAVWQQFEAAIQALPEPLLSDSARFAWMQGCALGVGLVEDFTNHLVEEHVPLIRAWLAQVSNAA